MNLWSGASFAAVRANYDVALALDGKTQSTRSTTAVQSGAAIVSDFDRAEVRLVPTLAADGNYELDVSVVSRSASPNAIATPEVRTFRGQLGTPLEFEANFDTMRVNDAILLHAAPD